MIQKFIIHFSVLLWFLGATCSTRQPPSPSQKTTITMVTDGLSVSADIIRSVSVGVNSMLGVAGKNSVEFYVFSSADTDDLFLVNFQTGHCESVLSNGGESLKQVHGICSKSNRKVVLVDRAANKVN